MLFGRRYAFNWCVFWAVLAVGRLAGTGEASAAASSLSVELDRHLIVQNRQSPREIRARQPQARNVQGWKRAVRKGSPRAQECPHYPNPLMQVAGADSRAENMGDGPR
eukprot:360328-Chlamydomonas_euryale.AAC.4